MQTPDQSQAAQRAQKQKPDVAIEEESVAGEEDPGASLDLPEDRTPGDEHAAVQPPRTAGGEQQSAVD